MENGLPLDFAADDGVGPVPRDRRYTVLLRGVIGRAGTRNRMPLTVRNISSQGLRGECAYPPRPGDPVEIDLPGLGPIAAEGRWGDGQTIGVAFDGPIDPTLAFSRNRARVRRSGLLAAH